MTYYPTVIYSTLIFNLTFYKVASESGHGDQSAKAMGFQQQLRNPMVLKFAHLMWDILLCLSNCKQQTPAVEKSTTHTSAATDKILNNVSADIFGTETKAVHIQGGHNKSNISKNKECVQKMLLCCCLVRARSNSAGPV